MGFGFVVARFGLFLQVLQSGQRNLPARPYGPSFWFGTAAKTFESVLSKDPNCAMAYWGIAIDKLGNSLAGPPGLADAKLGFEAVERARALHAKTRREREWADKAREGLWNKAEEIGHEAADRVRNLAEHKAGAADG